MWIAFHPHFFSHLEFLFLTNGKCLKGSLFFKKKSLITILRSCNTHRNNYIWFLENKLPTSNTFKTKFKAHSTIPIMRHITFSFYIHPKMNPSLWVISYFSNLVRDALYPKCLRTQKNKFISEKGKALYLAVPRHKVLKACV